ncbi:MAG: class I SAM-dependent methyltransferase, partial [Nocardioides sp.]|nr:class I SAM-dependent methyltransferase [Nocardioides sp.]
MTARSLSFGEVAETYERFRPGYPDELVGRVTAVAEGRVVRAIEIGAGTGKATRVFAAAGIEVVATEPDPAMLAVLARECAELPVTPVRTAL